MAQNVIEQAGTVDQIQNYLLPAGGGFTLTNVGFAGDLDAVGVFDSLDLSPELQFSRGVLLTSGSGVPSRSNTSNSDGQNNEAEGDVDLTAFAALAFGDAGVTRDASVLTLTFNVTDANVKSLSFDIAFGTEEYPEYVNSSYVDIGAVWTGTGAGAKNYALINGTEPLAVTQANLSLGNFINNTSGTHAIQYDGLVNRQTILVPVQQGVNVIRLGVADTGDSAYDSGLFIFGIKGSGSDNTGTFQEVEVQAGGTYDSDADDNIYTGSASNFNNTHFINLSDQDQLFITNYQYTQKSATLGNGSLKIKLDTNGDDKVDTTITLEDPVQNATVVFSATGEGTAITLDLLEQASVEDDDISGTDGLDYIAGGAGDDLLIGLAGSDALSGGEGADVLMGGDGADDLNGGAGADLLEGGAGADTLTGGSGADVFFFDTKAANTGVDKILDLATNDFLVTTTKIFDSNNDGVITFGKNKTLDLFNGGLVLATENGDKAVTKLFYGGAFESNDEQFFVYSTVQNAGAVGAVQTYFPELAA